MDHVGRIQPQPTRVADARRVRAPARDPRDRGRGFLEEMRARGAAEGEPEPEEAAEPEHAPHRPPTDPDAGGLVDVLA